ncbi:MAG: ActS/PrrB/RegB family redox-sensitive histidine kinase [Caulobacteraceae bacterium]
MTATWVPRSSTARVGEAGEVRPDTPPPTGAQGGVIHVRRLPNRTLIRLRWLAITGQALMLLAVALWLKFPVPYWPCIAIILASALLNLSLTLAGAGRRRARPWEAGGQLAFDIVQLSALLFFTGGVVNPFCLLLIAPVTVGAATLGLRPVVALGGLAIGVSVVLAATALPMPWAVGVSLQLPVVYRIGCVLALIVGICVTGGYAFWAASEAARMELALHVTEAVLAREQRLSALGGLAAAAAHELGTPLATIAVVAKELARETPSGPLRDDAWLMVAQAQRCRDILQRLAQAPETGDPLLKRVSLPQFIREVSASWAGKPAVRVEGVVSGPPGMPAPDLWRHPEALHAVTAFVENAFDFARAEILITARFDARTVAIEVRDDGPGIAPDVMAKLGEPYVTSRPRAEGSRTGHVGMGLGFFIAKTLLERTGARVDFRNASRGGAIVTTRWPRERIEAI